MSESHSLASSHPPPVAIKNSEVRPVHMSLEDSIRNIVREEVQRLTYRPYNHAEPIDESFANAVLHLVKSNDSIRRQIEMITDSDIEQRVQENFDENFSSFFDTHMQECVVGRQ